MKGVEQHCALFLRMSVWCPLLHASKELKIDGGDLSTGTSRNRLGCPAPFISTCCHYPSKGSQIKCNCIIEMSRLWNNTCNYMQQHTSRRRLVHFVVLKMSRKHRTIYHYTILHSPWTALFINSVHLTNAYKSKYDSYVVSEAAKMGKHKWNRPKFCMYAQHATGHQWKLQKYISLQFPMDTMSLSNNSPIYWHCLNLYWLSHQLLIHRESSSVMLG